MEPKSDIPKLPDMVMCGDHPSFTKTELNVKDLEDEKTPVTTPSRTDRLGDRGERIERVERVERVVERAGERTSERPSERTSERTSERAGERRVRATSEHGLRAEIRRRVDAPRSDATPGNGALIQAALGSFRWPPYLLAVWVLVLILTHALHCLVTCMERALPHLKQLCHYFRTWAEDTWKAEADAKRVFPLALAIVTGLLYAFYFALYVLYSIALWSIEPLSTESEPKASTHTQEGTETQVTDYVESSKSDVSVKQP